MQVAIIGTGSVGSALTDGLTAAGHDVVLGSRDPAAASLEGETAADEVDVLDQRDAAAAGDVVVLAVPGGVVADLAADLAGALAGKPVVDTTNEYPTPTSEQPLAERVAAAAPEADVVKAFNTIGAEHMRDPVVGGETATMYVAGDDPTARDNVADLAEDLGFDAFVVGDLASAGHLEHLARFWIDLAGDFGRDVAFRLARA